MTKRKDILTIPQAAKFCSVDRVTMWRWVKSGNLRVSVTPGGHHRILLEDLETFLVEYGMNPIARKIFPKPRVLIVDDDVFVRKALFKTFSGKGYETVTAGDGFEAGVKLMQHRPHLVILDLIMAGMNGFDVLKHLRSDPKTSDTRVLVLTGYDTAENRKRVFEYGADGYLVKPVSETVLLQHVKELLAGVKGIRAEAAM